MKISEAIKKLEMYKSRFGDLNLVMPITPKTCKVNGANIEFSNDEKVLLITNQEN